MVIANTTTSIPSLPAEKPYFSKLESVFEKYSASQAAVQDIWSVGLSASPSIEEDPSFAVIDNYRTGRTSSYIDPLDLFDNSPASSIATISPRELSVSSGTGFDHSPLFEDAELDDSNSWESLFTEDSTIIPSAAATAAPLIPEVQSIMSSTVSSSVSSAAQSPAVVPIKMESISTPTIIDPLPSSSNKRKRSSEITVDLQEEKKDALGIIAYNRKPRSTPLQPVLVDDDGDCIAVKRARNTEAARRSRARKMERMSQLEERVDQLLAKNNELEAEIARLRKLCPSEDL